MRNEDSSYDWPGHRTHRPANLDKSEVLRAEPQGNDVAEDHLGKRNNSSSSRALDTPANKHYCEVVGDGADDGSGREEHQRGEKELLTAEELGQRGNDRLEDATA